MTAANQNSSTASGRPPQLELDEKDREDSLTPTDMDASIEDPTPSMSANQISFGTSGAPRGAETDLICPSGGLRQRFKHYHQVQQAKYK